MVGTYFPFVQFLGDVGDAIVLGVGAGLVASGHLTTGALIAFILYLDLFFSPIQQLSQVFDSWQQTRVSVGARRRADGPRDAHARGAPSRHALPAERCHHGSRECVSRTRRAGPATPAPDLRRSRRCVGSTSRSPQASSWLSWARREPGSRRSSSCWPVSTTRPQERSSSTAPTFAPMTFPPTVASSGTFPRKASCSRARSGTTSPTGARTRATARSRPQQIPLAPTSSSPSSRTATGPRSPNGGARSRQASASSSRSRRAELVNPAILLLDEATSNLDLAAEARVASATDRVARGRTTVVIAHRLQTARMADRIIVLANGTIAERAPTTSSSRGWALRRDVESVRPRSRPHLSTMQYLDDAAFPASRRPRLPERPARPGVPGQQQRWPLACSAMRGALTCVAALRHLAGCRCRRAGPCGHAFGSRRRPRQLVVVSSPTYDPPGYLASFRSFPRANAASPGSRCSRPGRPRSAPATSSTSATRATTPPRPASSPSAPRCTAPSPNPGGLHEAYHQLVCGDWWDEDPY